MGRDRESGNNPVISMRDGGRDPPHRLDDGLGGRRRADPRPPVPIKKRDRDFRNGTPATASRARGTSWPPRTPPSWRPALSGGPLLGGYLEPRQLRFTRRRRLRRKGRLIRWTVEGSTPNRTAILRTPSVRPGLFRASRIRSTSAGASGGLPRRFPSLLARFRPARTRSWMIDLSNSANTPSIWNMALPAGVMVSRPC